MSALAARAVLAIVAGVAGVAFGAGVAHAQDATSELQTYRVQKGDTLDVLAAEFYGDHAQSVFIVAANKLQRARPLRPGERLKIPVTRPIVTAKGDTFETLAQNYLGDAKRAPFLADFNKMSVEDSLATGTSLTIPFHIAHVAAANETLANVSLVYFGNAKQADVIKRYNALDKTALEKGEIVDVPIMNVHMREAKLAQVDPESKQRGELRKAAAAEVGAALPAARMSWLQGDFAAVKTALAPLVNKTDYLDAASAIEIELLLGRAYVAFDDTASAVTAFAAVLDRRPRYELSVYSDSPKVIDAWKKAGGHIHGE